MFSADRNDAETMCDKGSVNEVVDSDKLLNHPEELTASLAQEPPITQGVT